MAVMAVWAAVLITYGVFTGIAMDSTTLGSNGVLPLDMALDSVDDMYTGCKDEMKSKVQEEYLQNEKNKITNFTQAWSKGEDKCNSLNHSDNLGKEQIMAVYVYTLDKPNIYHDFNDAVRTQKCNYTTTFSYHTLHFFLTDALQTLNTLKPEAERCVTGYRRVDRYFSQDVLNKEIRFGSFTSSSMGWYLSAEIFGNKSCFEIITCSGANISEYSEFKEEREVLIPPYEVFKVTNITKL